MLDLQHTPATSPTSGWSPLQAPDESLAVAHDVAVQVRDAGYTPIAATVTGSRLRGLDTPTSDNDVLVVVTEPATAWPKTGPITASFTLDNNREGQLVNLEDFLTKIDVSVPYAEARYSPVLLTIPQYMPLIFARHVNPLPLEVHAARFALHAARRPGNSVRKAANNALAAFNIVENMNPTMCRQDAEPGSSRMTAVGHRLMEEYATYFTDHPHVEAMPDTMRLVINYCLGNG